MLGNREKTIVCRGGIYMYTTQFCMKFFMNERKQGSYVFTDNHDIFQITSNMVYIFIFLLPLTLTYCLCWMKCLVCIESYLNTLLSLFLRKKHCYCKGCRVRLLHYLNFQTDCIVTYWVPVSV